MNGQEMMLNAAMKLMGITPESIQATLGELKQIGAVAREFRDSMARIEAKQDRILELLSQQSGNVPVTALIELDANQPNQEEN